MMRSGLDIVVLCFLTATRVNALQVDMTVIDAQTKAPIAVFQVIDGGYEAGERIRWQWRRRWNGANGTASFEHRGAWERELYRIEADGYMPAVSRTVLRDEGAAELTFELERHDGFVSQIVTPGGAPAAGAQVLLCTNSMEGSLRNGVLKARFEGYRVIADDDGKFRLPPEADEFLIAAAHDAGFVVVTRAQYTDSSHITLEHWGILQGRVLTTGGEPVADAAVEAHAGRPDEMIYFSPGSQVKTNATGHFVFDRLAPGQYFVNRAVAAHDDGRPRFFHELRAQTDVHAGTTSTLTLGGPGRPVIGRIELVEPIPEFDPATITVKFSLRWTREFFPDDRKYNQAFAQFRRSEQASAYAPEPVRVQADGSFRRDRLPHGQYYCTVSMAPTTTSTADGSITLAGRVVRRFTQPAAVDGDSDEPFDLGPITLRPRRLLRAAEQAPLFEVATLDGQPLRLTDYRGKYVLLDFWATWCGPCIGETPHLKATWDALKDNDRLVIIGLSLDRSRDKPRDYAAKHELGWVQGFLGDWSADTVTKAYGVNSIPQIMLIGPDGKVIVKGLRGERIKAAVEQALASAPAAP